jgi:hypothetical protein
MINQQDNERKKKAIPIVVLKKWEMGCTHSVNALQDICSGI